MDLKYQIGRTMPVALLIYSLATMVGGMMIGYVRYSSIHSLNARPFVEYVEIVESVKYLDFHHYPWTIFRIGGGPPPFCNTMAQNNFDDNDPTMIDDKMVVCGRSRDPRRKILC